MQLYVALADHLGADLLSDDRRLAKGPGLPVRVLWASYGTGYSVP